MRMKKNSTTPSAFLDRTDGGNDDSQVRKCIQGRRCGNGRGRASRVFHRPRFGPGRGRVRRGRQDEHFWNRPQNGVPYGSQTLTRNRFSSGSGPAENVAFRATSAVRSDEHDWLSPPCSLISRAARCPSRDGMSRERTTSSDPSNVLVHGFVPASQSSTLKFRVLNQVAQPHGRHGVVVNNEHGWCDSSSTSVPVPCQSTQRNER